MKRTSLLLVLVLALYGAYLVKAGAGIDISSRYSAPKLLKLPLRYVPDWVPHWVPPA